MYHSPLLGSFRGSSAPLLARDGLGANLQVAKTVLDRTFLPQRGSGWQQVEPAAAMADRGECCHTRRQRLQKLGYLARRKPKDSFRRSYHRRAATHEISSSEPDDANTDVEPSLSAQIPVRAATWSACTPIEVHAMIGPAPRCLRHNDHHPPVATRQ